MKFQLNNQPRLNNQMAALFCVALICGTVLVALGHLDGKWLVGVMGAWLFPAPFQIGAKDE